MIRQFSDFRKDKLSNKSSTTKGASSEKIIKKQINENKKVDAGKDKPQAGNNNSINFLKNAKTPRVAPREEFPQEPPRRTPINENPINPNSEERPKPVLNEGFLSREFLENFIGRPLNQGDNRQQQYNNTQQQQGRKEEPVSNPYKEPIKKDTPKNKVNDDEHIRKPQTREERKEQVYEEPVYEDEEIQDDEEIIDDEPINYNKDSNLYKIFRDKAETFECRIHVDGSTLNNTKVRLLIESPEWNAYFNGRMSPDGKCVIPLKKMSILPEGTTGNIMLEVTVEDTVFYPWKETFRVETSKKVRVDILSGKNQKSTGPKVRVSGL